jgi:hypothetical protein
MSKWKLIDNVTAAEIKIGDHRSTFRNEPVIVMGSLPPHKPESIGKVSAPMRPAKRCCYYPGVINAKFVEISNS